MLTGAVESFGSGDIKHDPSDGKQNPSTVVPVELCEGARGICGEEQRRLMCAGHPRVASFELCGGSAWQGGRGKENALEKVKKVEQQGGVNWVREQGRHLAANFTSGKGKELCKQTVPDVSLFYKTGCRQADDGTHLVRRVTVVCLGT